MHCIPVRTAVIREKRMRPRHFRGILVLMMAGAIIGCTRMSRAKDGSSAMRHPATARITNNGWLDVNVFASVSESRQRLGTVTGQNTHVFTLPDRLVDARGLRIHIEPIGSEQSYQTDLIALGPGQRIDLVVQQRLSMSHYSVVDP